MKKIGMLLIIVVLFFLNASSHATTRVAVIELKPSVSIKKETAEVLTDILRSALFDTGQFEVINREDMQDLLKEAQFQESVYCDKTTCIVQMGKYLGVPKMVAGKIGKLGTKFVITIKIVDVATAKNDIIVKESCQCPVEKLEGSIITAASRLAGKGPPKPTPLAPTATPKPIGKQIGQFIDYGDGTVTDTVTGLMWTKKDSWNFMNEGITWGNARSYVARLRVGGYSDWRIPTINELKTIFSKKNPKIQGGKRYLYLPAVFAPGGACYFWSSDVMPSSHAKYLNFQNGGVRSGHQNDRYRLGVRAVRYP